MSSIPDLPGAREALQEHFGFRDFQPGQAEVISAILAGRDCLAIMPTGGGKSLCYQLPALVHEGVTVVVSPLIALMKDQVDGLRRKGVAAEFLNSTQTAAEQRDAMDRLASGECKLLYVAPERFRQNSFVDRLGRLKLFLVAIDEAHCLSQWGHDFRPDYLRLGEALNKLGAPQTAAFTATATEEVRRDILKQLRLRDPFVIARGFARPNLKLNITPCADKQDKLKRLRAIVREWKTGIVYCATRKRVEEVAEALQGAELKVQLYHGALSAAERKTAQEIFLEKKADIVVATNAFGMGIDRDDVRFVAHYELPGSVEAYYQEAGRGGRDGREAWCELFYNYADTRTQEFFLDGANPEEEVIRRVYGLLLRLADEDGEVAAPIFALAEELGLSNDMAVSTSLTHLTRAGLIERHDIPGQRIRGTRVLHPDIPPEDAPLDTAALRGKARRDRARLQAMLSLCGTGQCVQQWILDYFGEAGAVRCEACHNCVGGEAQEYRPLSEEQTTVVRKTLAGVARASVRTAYGWEGKFGRQRIAAMLRGSQDVDTKRGGLDGLSTFGILRNQTDDFLLSLMRELEQAGCLETSGGLYPLLTLTEKGDAIMKSEGGLSLRWPSAANRARLDSKPAASRKKAVADIILREARERALFNTLKEKRAELMKEHQVPAYCILSNRALTALAKHRPKTAEEALQLPGIGKTNADTRLPPFLDIIREEDE